MKIIAAAMAAVLMVQPVMAERLPELGDASQEGLTPQQEREIGETAMREIRRSGEMVDDPEIIAYITWLGAKLTYAAEVTEPQFTFFPLLDPSINAFAMPGGYVGVHTGLIVQAQHESEVAGVLAHEIAHVTQHHMARMVEGMKSAPWVTLAAIAAAILAGSAGRGDAAAAIISGGMAVQVRRQLDYTYSFEQEADRIGMQTLQQSGFDPSAMATFFEKLQNYNRIVENNAPEFLRTHPVTSKRISEAQSRLGQMPYKQVPDSADFLFVREKCRTLQMKGRESINYYQKMIAEKRYANEAAQRYGLALAHYMNREYESAWQALQKAKASFEGGKTSHPALEYLAGNIRLAQGKNTEAVNILTAASRRFSASRALTYGLIDAQIAAGDYKAAQDEIDDALSMYASDPQLYLRSAKLYAKQGKIMLQYQMQGEYYARLKEYTMALEQFQLALRQPGEDFYLRSGIEVRVRELTPLVMSDQKK
ncbi:M48 family metallopeptidase [Chitinibacter bivalviorum]|uniref:M48 family metallopeptidase n=1 Tax=Chitinibacter bivalviorum TaxID=2739434 RepID=A0A7H9BLZ1_9NEIS|nr:M48 family metalloprotease [Chitinibacter bivalviorum]QLG88374.1 M48 family metallopeptidase [Chitinibacter bivalviorum]